MPLAAPGLTLLGQGFLPLFREVDPISKTVDAARAWAPAVMSGSAIDSGRVAVMMKAASL